MTQPFSIVARVAPGWRLRVALEPDPPSLPSSVVDTTGELVDEITEVRPRGLAKCRPELRVVRGGKAA